MSSTNVGKINQIVETLSGSGQMTALKAETIKGNVYVGKISQVLMVSLSDDGREESANRFVTPDTLPYKFLYPYTATDEALFRGRTAEIEIIQNRIKEQRVLVVHGQARVGKTSLLAAGVMPAMARGTKRNPPVFTLLIENYEEPEKTIIEGLSAVARTAADNEVADKHLSFDGSQMLELPLLLQSIIKQSEKTLLLVLDQFERLFEPPVTLGQREAFLNHLAEALQTIEEEKLRVIIVVRNEALEKLSDLEKPLKVQGPLQNVLQYPVPVRPLTRDDARRAIEDPLHEVRPQTKKIYDGDIVNTYLLPDLDELSPDEPGLIYPQHLQIVCTQLYLSAHEKKGDTLIIDTGLYVNELKGAESILASFMRDRLKTGLNEDQQELAVQLLAVMSVPGLQRWIKPGEFDLKDTDEEEIKQVLEFLVEEKFLIQNFDGDEKKYALVSQMITTELRRLSGTGEEVEERYKAEDELERIWYTWLSLEHLASREQVRYLTKSGGHLEPRAAKTLLLLRSAIEQDEQAGTWVERLRGNQGKSKGAESREGKELIEQLEIPDKTPQGQRIGSAMLGHARKLLGFPAEKKAETPEAETTTTPEPPAQPALFGPIAEKAVSAPLSNIRQTCALALAAADPDLAIKHLDAALKTVGGSWRRLRRKSELRGALADADPQIAQLNSELPLLQRILIWRWRASRRIARDKHRLAVLTLGGAVGAGLGVGLLRAIMALPPHDTNEVPGVLFGIHFFYVGALGAALAYGAALASPLQLIRTKASDRITESDSWRSHLRATLLTVALGTIFFGLLHSILVWLNGLSLADNKAYRVILMGFVAGFGLSLALTFHLRGKRLLSVQNWLLSWVLACLTLVFINWYFVHMRETQNDPMEILFTRSPDYLQIAAGSQELAAAEDPGVTAPWWLTLFRKYSGDFNHLAVIYAILTGVVLITGLILGMRWANKSLQKAGREPGQTRA